MITKKFAKRVVADCLKGLATVTNSGTKYYCEYVGVDGSVIETNEYRHYRDPWHKCYTGQDLNREPGVYVRRIDKEDPEYHPIVAAYHIGAGWIICG